MATQSLSLAGTSTLICGLRISLASLVGIHLNLRVEQTAKKVFTVLEMVDWECRIMAFFTRSIIMHPSHLRLR